MTFKPKDITLHKVMAQLLQAHARARMRAGTKAMACQPLAMARHQDMGLHSGDIALIRRVLVKFILMRESARPIKGVRRVETPGTGQMVILIMVMVMVTIIMVTMTLVVPMLATMAMVALLQIKLEPE
jgi:hypothetical protein